MRFSLWAPLAKSADLVLEGRRIALHPGSDGFWGVEAAARTGTRYRFSVNGGDPLPDPRSLWQPDGVHGDSQVIDTAELRQLHAEGFEPRPLRDAVIYELHVGTFTPEGTYQAAQAKLAHLAALGITHVEVMPVATFPGRHGWGYDGVYHFAPMPTYGTPHDLARFVAACHRHGLAVLLDVVYNHFGPDGNYVTAFGPYLTDRVKTPWGDAVNYDGPWSDGVRSFFIDNAVMWLEDYGFDGLRLDAVHAIFSFEAVHFLEDLATSVRNLGNKLHRHLVLIGESDLNEPRLVHPPHQGGYGLNAHWSDDFHHAVHAYFTNDSNGYYVDFHGLEDVATALRAGYVYQGQYSRHRRRRHGRSPEGVQSRQLVVCAQNHDQVGNRAQGERLSMLLEAPELKAIAALVLLSPFVPLLFQGEEWGARTPFIYFTDHENEELGRLVIEGRTREFKAFDWRGDVPNPQAPESFERSRLDWGELDAGGHQDLLEWYRRVIALRHTALGAFEHTAAAVKFDGAAAWLTFGVADLLVAFNFAARAQPLPVAPEDWEMILSSAGPADRPSTEFPARVTRIFRRR
jgi:maltooligosyltrehalose trehalohydrolase